VIRPPISRLPPTLPGCCASTKPKKRLDIRGVGKAFRYRIKKHVPSTWEKGDREGRYRRHYLKKMHRRKKTLPEMAPSATPRSYNTPSCKRKRQSRGSSSHFVTAESWLRQCRPKLRNAHRGKRPDQIASRLDGCAAKGVEKKKEREDLHRAYAPTYKVQPRLKKKGDERGEMAL